MKARVFDYKKCTMTVPFIAMKSKDEYIRYINYEDGSYIKKIPQKPVVDFIRKQKDTIFENGFIDKEDYIITNINTDSFGWPIDMDIVLINKPRSQKENLLCYFEYTYKEDDNGREILKRITDFILVYSRQPDDFEIIYKRDDMAHMKRRNNKIYNDHVNGMSNEEISKKYFLKVSTVQKIINQIKEQDELRHEFYNALDSYLEDKYPKYAYRIEHNFMMYLYTNDIYKREDIFNLINSNTKITGIGKAYKRILREFVEFQIQALSNNERD